MMVRKIRLFSLVFLLVLDCLLNTGFAMTRTITFVPASEANSLTEPYYASSKVTNQIGYAPVSAGANANTGYVGIYNSAWIGGSAASAWQCVEFDALYRSSVKAEVTINCSEDTANFGFAAFSSLAWQWELDNGSVHRNDIHPAFTWEDILEKIIGIVMLYNEEEVSIEDAIYDAAETITDAVVLATELKKACTEGKGETLKKTFRFTVDPGTHHLWVGARGEASGVITGSGFSVLFGQIQKIELTITDSYGGPPDLIVQSIDVVDPNFGGPSLLSLQRGKTADFEVAISNVGLAPAISTGYYFGVREPNEPDYTTVVSNSTLGDGYFNYATTIYRNPTYTFTKKGNHSFKAIVDPFNYVSESDETNNELIKEYYVKGLPPTKPTKPTVPSDHKLYRNNSHTFITSSTDPDGDSMQYIFVFQRSGQDRVWSEGPWSDSNSLSYTPYELDNTTKAGTYYVWTRAKDSDGLYSELSDKEFFEIVDNTAPDAPGRDAPDNGYTVDNIPFTVSGSDKENDRFGYRFDWGDGSAITDYFWPSERGGSVTVTHKFSTAGTYYVKVQAKDSLGAESAWSSQPIDITVYVPPVGSITVTTNNPAVTFSVSGPENFNGSGTCWTTQAASGGYTVTFNDITYYNTPAAMTKTLNTGQSITFDGQYTHQTGAIQVSTNLASASFTVTGHWSAQGQKFTGSGIVAGPWTAYTGGYTIVYDKVNGYCLPSTTNELKTLQSNQTITFNGRYVRPPVASLTVPEMPGGFAIAGETLVQFVGSASYSPESDLTISKYKFDFGNGDYYTEIEDDATDGVFDGNTINVFERSGYYTASLFVQDSLDNWNVNSATRVVHVKSRPIASITLIDPSPSIAGETVNFTGQGTDPDGDAIITYVWQSSIDGILSDQRTFSTNGLTAGLHTISFRVKDSDNLWSAWTGKILLVYNPMPWPFFKIDPPRLSCQGAYWGRLHGLLGYTQSWAYNSHATIEGSPVAANLDNNLINGLEIAFTSSGGTLYVLDNANNLLWSRNIGPSKSTPAIADIDNDGNLDVVVGSTMGVYAYDRNGNNIYTFNNPVPGQGFESSPVVADIDGNPMNGKETIIGNSGGFVYVIDKLGLQCWAFMSPTMQSFTSSAAVADIEPLIPGLETVIGCSDGFLYVINANGFPVASYATPALSPILTTPAVADLNPTLPGPEIVFGADNGSLYCVNYNNFMLNLSWSYATNPLKPVRSSPAISSVGYGSMPHIVFGCDNGNVYVLKDIGGACQLLGTFRCGQAGDNTMVRSTPAIANIDTINNINHTYGDMAEVIVGATDGKLYCLSFANGAGVNLPGTPLLVLGAAQPILSSAAVADIDHDPDLEILIGANDMNLHMLKALKNPALVPVANFAAPAPQSGNSPFDVNFIDQSTNTPLVWTWDFGDGTTSTQQNPQHTFTAPGTYTVSLTAANAHGSNTMTKNDYITVYTKPVPDFTCSSVSGTVPFTVDFTDQSQYSPTSWSWTFGDTGTSALQNPSHNYTEPGLYTVSLTVSNSHGSNVLTRTDCILAKAPQPIADFSQDKTYGLPPLSVSFTDWSTGSPDSWLWDFGDGSTSFDQNPTHIYEVPGRFLVSLMASNSTGSHTKTNSTSIRVYYFLADFNLDGTVDTDDLVLLVNDWLQTDSVVDIYPFPDNDGIVDIGDFGLFAQQWLETVIL